MSNKETPTLAEALRAKIDSEELTQRQAADEIGCSPDQLSRWLSGSEAESHWDGIIAFLGVSWTTFAEYSLRQKQERLAAKRRP